MQVKFLLIVGTCFESCKKECFNLCNLFSLTEVANDSIILGMETEVFSSIENKAIPEINCTLKAEISISEFQVEYRNDQMGKWERIHTELLSNKSLGAAEIDKATIRISFNQSGLFRFITIADVDNKIYQRDETNNKSCYGCRRLPSNNISYSEVIKVYPKTNNINSSWKNVDILEIKR